MIAASSTPGIAFIRRSSSRLKVAFPGETEIRIHLRIVGLWQPNAGGDELGRIKAWIFLQQVAQRAQQQAGSNHKHDRKRQFRHDQSIAQSTGSSAVSGASRHLLELSRGESGPR